MGNTTLLFHYRATHKCRKILLECFSYQKKTNVLNNLATREGENEGNYLFNHSNINI